MIVLAVIGVLMVIGLLAFLAAIGFTPAFALLVVGLVLMLMAVHGGSRATRRK
ncbi:MAG: hypothetical protein ACRDY2_01055 [Acidimicrobiales bacterium]